MLRPDARSSWYVGHLSMLRCPVTWSTMDDTPATPSTVLEPGAISVRPASSTCQGQYFITTVHFCLKATGEPNQIMRSCRKSMPLSLSIPQRISDYITVHVVKNR